MEILGFVHLIEPAGYLAFILWMVAFGAILVAVWYVARSDREEPSPSQRQPHPNFVSRSFYDLAKDYATFELPGEWDKTPFVFQNLGASSGTPELLSENLYLRIRVQQTMDLARVEATLTEIGSKGNTVHSKRLYLPNV